LVGFEVALEEKKNGCNILVEIPEGGDHLGSLGVEGGIILK
jgi:hypothetical protein